MLVGKLERCDELVQPVFPERARRGESRDALATRPTDPLFVRRDGSALSPQALDRLVRGLAERAGVVLPAGAAAHAFRHHYGVTLARTTSSYTTVASTQLISALDDAGLLGWGR
jgi:integrase